MLWNSVTLEVCIAYVHEMSLTMRFSILTLLFAFVTLTTSAQAPTRSELHIPSAFDNSYAGTLSGGGHARSMGDERYGFAAIFEVRVAPGVVKTMDVRQYFGSEELSVQGFMRVKASLAGKAHLVHVNWLTPTEGGNLIGN